MYEIFILITSGSCHIVVVEAERQGVSYRVCLADLLPYDSLVSNQSPFDRLFLIIHKRVCISFTIDVLREKC